MNSKENGNFHDISEIKNMHTDLQFSVQSIFENQYHFKPKQITHPKQSNRKQHETNQYGNKRNIKKYGESKQPQNYKLEKVKSTNKIIPSHLNLIHQKVNPNNKLLEEKETFQEDSDTIKITNAKSQNKKKIERKESKHTEIHNIVKKNIHSKQIQPQTFNRNRTKSNISRKSSRSQSINTGEIKGLPSKINTVHSNSRIRCATKTGINQDIQTDHQKIIMNDYFGQNHPLKNNQKHVQFIVEKKQSKKQKNKSLSHQKNILQRNKSQKILSKKIIYSSFCPNK